MVATLAWVVMDIPVFAYRWTDVAGTFDKRPVAETGFDAHFAVWTLMFVASVVLFYWAARRTLAARRQTQTSHEGGQANEFAAKVR